ncbi:amino acid ABC transporter substrate-binding protein [Pandoraea pulmonicola]|nr:amino acid ABC transporter substrate-binding protein [Pandoraea pulmonicola]
MTLMMLMTAAIIPSTAYAGEPTMPGMPRLNGIAPPPYAIDASAPDLSSEAAAALPPTMVRIRERGRIVLGYRQSAAPFSYVDANDQPIGLAWALCQRIVAVLQREMAMSSLPVTAVRVIEQMRAPLVEADAIDIDCAPSTVTAARERQVAFSLPYYASNVRLMVRRGSGIASLDHMRGLRLVVVQGTTAERLVRAQHARSGFQLLMARDYADAFRMLRAHRAQAFALDDVLLEGLRATGKTPDAFEIVGPALSEQPESYALVLPKDDPAFKTHVDAALAQIFQNGEMAQLQYEWFQSPLPPYGHNLQSAPSADVVALWAAGARFDAASDDGATARVEQGASAVSTDPGS